MCDQTFLRKNDHQKLEEIWSIKFVSNLNTKQIYGLSIDSPMFNVNYLTMHKALHSPFSLFYTIQEFGAHISLDMKLKDYSGALHSLFFRYFTRYNFFKFLCDLSGSLYRAGGYFYEVSYPCDRKKISMKNYRDVRVFYLSPLCTLNQHKLRDVVSKSAANIFKGNNLRHSIDVLNT